MDEETFRYDLQPLRIQGNWKVVFNNFTEFDIERDDNKNAFDYLAEDLLRLLYQTDENSTILAIDLSWYPDGNINGSYILVMVKDYDWLNPLEELRTRNKAEIVSHIEYWVDSGHFQQFL